MPSNMPQSIQEKTLSSQFEGQSSVHLIRIWHTRSQVRTPCAAAARPVPIYTANPTDRCMMWHNWLSASLERGEYCGVSSLLSWARLSSRPATKFSYICSSHFKRRPVFSHTSSRGHRHLCEAGGAVLREVLRREDRSYPEHCVSRLVNRSASQLSNCSPVQAKI